MRIVLGEVLGCPRHVALVAALAFGALSAGCTSAPSAAPTATGSPSVRERITEFFSPKTTSDSVMTDPVSPEEMHCPAVDVRQGASTLTIPPPGPDGGALTLRYQGTIGPMARECKLGGGIMRMKVGVQGRILLGPAGGPGKLDVPLRYAVVQEGPEPKTIVTKFYKLPVTIPDAQPTVPFTHIDQDISFPMPPGLGIESYVVYVGFDAAAEKQQPQNKRAPARSR
jgi:hypothetical protein